MDILLAKPRGFCAGVDRAVSTAKDVIHEYGTPIYIKHSLVHNYDVVNELAGMGAITVDSPAEAPDGAVVLFSAHGSPPEHYKIAESKGQKVIDATCPLVYKVHDEAMAYSKNDYTIVLIGHADHIETMSTSKYAPSYIVDERKPEMVEETMRKLPKGSKVAVLTQTTLSVDETAKAANIIRRYFPDAVMRNDICYATTNRQGAVKELVRNGAECVIIVGSKISSNANRMRDVAESMGVPAFLIDEAAGILDKIAGYKTIGVSSGASTPEEQTMRLCNSIIERYGGAVRDIITKEEKIVFKGVEGRPRPSLA